jgi:DUF971 family protein
MPLDVRKKPIDVKVHVTTGAGVDITWSDGHASHYEFSYLRENCPCASCREGYKEKHNNFAGGIANGEAVLPLFKPRVTARAAASVGSYAVQIEFTDGHATGIFSFDHLREICPCDACAQEFRSKHTN